MLILIQKQKLIPSIRLLVLFIVFNLCFNLMIMPKAHAQSVLDLPLAGNMIFVSPGFNPAIIRGVRVHPDDPLRFDFIVDRGDNRLAGEVMKEEGLRMIKYFLAALTVPEDELWVNLSPFEKHRIIPEALGVTEMGRDFLSQDYLLKQFTASLMYPEKNLGRKFWDRVYKKVRVRYGTTDIPINTFNKVWIVPKSAVVYERWPSAFVSNSHLTVMLEEDYFALQESLGKENIGRSQFGKKDAQALSGISSQIVREILLPEIEKEVNEGEHFSRLRQIYNSMILAMWYKRTLTESLLGQVYVDRNKTKGIDIEDKEIKQKIYNQYMESFKKGVYDFIRADYGPDAQKVIPRKYFSGGMLKPQDFKIVRDEAQLISNTEVPGPMEVNDLVVLQMQGYEIGAGADLNAASPNQKTNGSAADFLEKIVLLENEDYLNRFLSEEGVFYQDILKFRKPSAKKSSVNLELQILVETVFQRVRRGGRTYYRLRDDIRQARLGQSLNETRVLLNGVKDIDFGNDPATRVGRKGDTKPFNRGNPMKDLRREQLEQLKEEVNSLVHRFQQRGDPVWIANRTNFVRENVQILINWLAERDELPEDYNLVWLAGSKFLSSAQEAVDLYHQKQTKIIITGGIGKDSSTILDLKENFGLTKEVEGKLTQLLDALAVMREQQGEMVMWKAIERRFNIRLGRDKRLAQKKKDGTLVPGHLEWLSFYRVFAEQKGGTDPILDIVNQEGEITSEEYILNRLLNKETRDRTLIPEALVYYAYLLSRGVAEEDIYVDAQSTNALENVFYGASILQREQDFEAQNIVAVQFPETARRIKATLKKQISLQGNYHRWDKDQYQIFMRAPQVYSDGKVLGRLGLEELEVMKQYVTGEVERFPLYYDSGSIVKVEIPEDVMIAYNQLTQEDAAETGEFKTKKRDQISGPDQAVIATAEISPVGGIDFNPVFLDLQFRRDSNGFLLPATQQPIYNMKIEGIFPVIINVLPVTPGILVGLEKRMSNN